MLHDVEADADANIRLTLKTKCTLACNVMIRSQVEGMMAKLMSMSVRFLAGGDTII